MFIVKLLFMIVLGLLSAALSVHRKNYYLRIFDDILGREEDDKMAVKLGRAFIYGFLFPVYFALVLAGLIALAAFLVVAGIIAAIIFVLVWITEKILPHESIGNVVQGFLSKIGISCAEPVRQVSTPACQATAPAEKAGPTPNSGSGCSCRTEPSRPDAPGGGINVTRRHNLD